MNKKIVKLAVIRTHESEPCPFGLSVNFSCKNVGSIIKNMAPLEMLGDKAIEEEKQAIINANNRLMVWNLKEERCPYAGKIFKDKNAVECNWGSNAPEQREVGLIGAPFYSKVYNNVAYDGIYSYPLGFYGDMNISRNTYYGIYSLLGHDIFIDGMFKKVAEEIVEKIISEFNRS